SVTLEPSPAGDGGAPEPRSAVDELVEKIRRYNPEADVEAVRRAYDYAVAAHGDQKRDSGAPYIDHPLQGANTLAHLELEPATICASLLHDVVEDTSIELSDVETRFGPEVARLVDGVTKLSQAEFEHREKDDHEEVEGGEPAPLSAGTEAEQKRRAA